MGLFCSCSKHREHEYNFVCNSNSSIKHFVSIECDNLCVTIT